MTSCTSLLIHFKHRCAKCHMEFLTKQGFVTHLNSKCTQMILPKPTWKKVNGRYLCDFQGCPSVSSGKSWCTTTGVRSQLYLIVFSHQLSPYRDSFSSVKKLNQEFSRANQDFLPKRWHNPDVGSMSSAKIFLNEIFCK